MQAPTPMNALETIIYYISAYMVVVIAAVFVVFTLVTVVEITVANIVTIYNLCWWAIIRVDGLVFRFILAALIVLLVVRLGMRIFRRF
jgi:hypothetical protein